MPEINFDLIVNTVESDESIAAVYLFGSYAKGKAAKFSDVDMAVLFEARVPKEEYADRQVALMLELSRVLNKEADVVILNSASLFMKYHVLKEGRKIYENPGRNEHSFEAMAIVQYLDFLPLKTRMEAGLLRHIKEAADG